jgi:hypothetical protein
LFPRRTRCLTTRQELSRQRVGLASQDNSDTHDSNGGRGRCCWRGRRGRRCSCGRVTGYTVAALVEDWRRRAAALVEDQGPADIEGARSWSHGSAAERPALGLGEPESVHRWTGTTCRAAPLACSDWSEERDVGRSRLDRVEGNSRHNGKQGRAIRHPRLAVTVV